MGSQPEGVVIVSQRLGDLSTADRSIEEAGAEVRSMPLWTARDIRVHGAGASLLIVGAVEPFEAQTLESLPACRAIVRRGVGYDNVDVDAATRLGIVVANVPDASVEEVSDHALALLLTLERRIPTIDSAVRDGVWLSKPQALRAMRGQVRRIGDLTLGIVGLGRIGRALARKATGLYGRIVAADPALSRSTTAPDVELSDLDHVLSVSDHVSLHLPYTGENHHVIGRDEIGRMRSGAVLVNAARGGLVDEAALAAALRAGRLAGAGLDATSQEPLGPDDPLLHAEGVLLTAHSAASSATAQADLARRSVEATIELLHGRPAASIVNPEVLGSPALRIPTLRQSSKSRGP